MYMYIHTCVYFMVYWLKKETQNPPTVKTFASSLEQLCTAYMYIHVHIHV